MILNLAVWFGLHTLFGEVWTYRTPVLELDIPVLASANFPAMVLTLAATVALFRFRMGMVTVLLGSAVAGLAYHAAAGTL